MASARHLNGMPAWANCCLFGMQQDIQYMQLLLTLDRPNSRDQQHTLNEIRALSSGGGARLSACIDSILLDSSR